MVCSVGTDYCPGTKVVMVHSMLSVAFLVSIISKIDLTL